jgi:hypothetical protein
MDLTYQIHKDGNLHPEAFNCLKLLPENFAYHTAHIQRHPFSIYSISIEKVMQAFSAILDEIDRINTALFDTTGNLLGHHLNNLPDLQEKLLYALQSHIDDCYRILKVIHPLSAEVCQERVERWLKDAEHPAYKQFHNSINTYVKSFEPIVNKIKHCGGQLRPMMMYPRGRGIVTQTVETNIQTFPKNVRIVGYFLEGMQPFGCIGPDHKIHPGGKTAISFNRDLRHHFANLYCIGRHLRDAIAQTVRHIHNAKLPRPVSVKDVASKYNLESIAERVSNLSPLFFQDEFSKPTPNIKFYRSDGNIELMIQTSGAQYMTWNGEVMIHYEIQLDGVCPDYQIPYP